jgi:hypothetical protein
MGSGTCVFPGPKIWLPQLAQENVKQGEAAEDVHQNNTALPISGDIIAAARIQSSTMRCPWMNLRVRNFAATKTTCSVKQTIVVV